MASARRNFTPLPRPPDPFADIVTSRLTLRLLGPEVTAACLAGDAGRAGLALGAEVPAEFLQRSSSLLHDQARLRESAAYAPWASRAMILRDAPVMVGRIRFHAPPDATALHTYARHAVELGYHVFIPHRRQGYAAEAVAAMMAWAALLGARHFVASVAPDNAASLAVIGRFGFIRVGEQMDEVDGLEYVFLRVADGSA